MEYCFFILSYKRAKFCHDNTFRLINSFRHSGKIFIVCSDDDSTIDEYIEIFGNQNVLIFNKERIQNIYDIDVMDCFNYEKKIGILWARNAVYEFARNLGYEHFIVLDDDYDSLHLKMIKYKGNKTILKEIRNIFNIMDFDTVASLMFDLLDSQPFISVVAFAQNGDFIGGSENRFVLEGYKFKAMNWFFHSTKKITRYIGRINEDVNRYLYNNNTGRLSLSISDISLHQFMTQNADNGMTDIYKKMGTYIKSFYSVMMNPSCCSIALIGNTYNKFNVFETMRIHHQIKFKYNVPKILNEKYSKTDKNNQKIEYYDIMKVKRFKLSDIDIVKLSNIKNISSNDDIEELF